MTWWRQVAERVLLSLLVSVCVTGCGGEMPSSGTPPIAGERPLKEEGLPAASAPQIGLTPLPSVRDVQESAPGGRADPFGRLAAADVQDPASGLTLTGVLMVGDQKRAMVTTASGSGVVCVGVDGRCGDDSPTLLPSGWSVVSIDVERGCIRLALNGEPQGPVCIA